MLTLALLLTTSPAVADEFVAAPAPMPWPEGLPEAVEGAEGTLLPPALALHVRDRLRYLDALPGLCRVRLLGLDAVHVAERLREAGVAEAACRLRVLEATARTSEGYSFWSILGVGAVAFGIGALLGFLAAFAAFVG